jgi:hypothetical protein
MSGVATKQAELTPDVRRVERVYFFRPSHDGGPGRPPAEVGQPDRDRMGRSAQREHGGIREMILSLLIGSPER